MEKTFCMYHPTKPALWFCQSCDAYFCSECITEQSISGGFNKKGVVYLCPKCSSLSERLAIQNIVEPFWNRLPKFFLYPFSIITVIFVVVLSIFLTMFSAPGILSKILQMLFFGILLKYCFAIIRETARGNMSPPKIDENTITGDFVIVGKYLVLCALFIIIAAAVFVACITMGMNTQIAILAAVFTYYFCLVFIFPATVIVLAANESLIDAVNPMISLRIAFRIGSSYFLMALCSMALSAAPGTLMYFARPYLPAFVSTYLLMLLGCYYTIVIHHLMGYVILQHHDDIGYDVDLEGQNISCSPKGKSAKEDNRGLTNNLNVLIKEGKHSEAISLIQTETQGHITDLDLAERYYNLLKIAQKIPEMLEHAKNYLLMLIKAQKKDAYRMVYLECVAAEPSFNPQASTLFKVAASLSEVGNYQAALGAYNRFIQTSPDDPMVPKAYLMAAQVFYEKMLSPDKAIKTLKRLIKSFPDNEITPYAQKYLRRIEQQA